MSALASAFPEIVAALVHERSPLAGEQVSTLRDRLGPLPFQAALKVIVASRGVPVGPDVRAPLRTLTDHELAAALEAARSVVRD